MLLAVPASAVAKPGFSVQGPQRWSEFSLPASNGYRISVSATAANGKPVPNVSIFASRGLQHLVEYSTRGHLTRGGAVKAKLPGVGRIAVRFTPTKVTREAVADNCKGRSSVIRHGVFRGTIEIHGEQGYTSVRRRSAPGKITQSFRQVCDQREFGQGGSRPLSEELLFAGARQGRRTIGFSVSRVDFGPKLGGPFVSFSASSLMRHNGFNVWALVTVQGEARDLSTPDPAGVLEDATVEPPSPLQGSATFHLDTPTSSSWSGSLSAELPGVGPVALTGPGFWSVLCEGEACTETLPSNVHMGVFSGGFSRLPARRLARQRAGGRATWQPVPVARDQPVDPRRDR